MRIHPLLAASVLVHVGVMSFGAMVFVEHRRARALRQRPAPEVEEADAPPAPPRAVPAVAPRRAPPPPPPVAPAAALRVRVTGPPGLRLDSVDVSARRDDELPTSLEQVEDELGSFAAVDLEPGRYEVEVAALGMRAVHVGDVRTGGPVVEVALERAPVLLGAVGLGDPSCAGVMVGWSSTDGQAGQAAVDADDCTFVIDGVLGEGPLTVVASRGARRESALVTVPLSGDPGVVCLAPPCAATPAALLVTVVDAARVMVDEATLTWTLKADELRGEMGTATGSGRQLLTGRRVGETLALRAEHGAASVETRTVVGAGVTEVVLTLPREEPDPDGDEERP